MERKLTFNEIAQEYDRYRPDYPEQLFHDVLAYSGIKPDNAILEIGCGTGQATKGFVNRGYDNLTCIELGPQLVAWTREKFNGNPRVQIINSAFEDWQSGELRFDLAISGTAFHFIETQEQGYRKVFELLRERGTIAFFWTIHVPVFDEVHERIREGYRDYAPHLEDSQTPSIEETIQERSDLTMKDGLFEDLQVKRYEWNKTYSVEDYVSLLKTNSRHRLLSDEAKVGLFQTIEDTIRQNGGTIVKPQAVALFLARKRGSSSAI